MKSDDSRLIVPSKPGQCPKKIPSSIPITLSDVDNINTLTLTYVVPLHTAYCCTTIRTHEHPHKTGGLHYFYRRVFSGSTIFHLLAERGTETRIRQTTLVLSVTLQAGSPVPTRQTHVVPAKGEGVVIPAGASAARVARAKGYHGGRSALIVPDHFDRGRFEGAVC